ncbi:hypothetical protein OF83DRAFT_1129364 [Amylostereum chailletii]|nr:hypothetical protein OF83DRAFT_1129364 [Amylostereum chailletii]
MSSSSSSSSSPSPSPEPPRKRKREAASLPEDPVTDPLPEETVLSHAAKRKEKKSKKHPAPAVDVPSESASTEKKKPKVKKDTSVPAPSKRQNSVWVGNLSFKTTSDGVRNFFDGAGEITRVHMPSKFVPGIGGPPKRENRGFAYVDFATPDAKIVAISMSENHLDGRKLLIKDGDDFTGRPAPAETEGKSKDGATKKPASAPGLSKTAQKILGAQKQPPAPTLFFGNLGFETTQESLRGLLEAHRTAEPKDEPTPDGEKKDVWIRKVRMGTFEDSGLCKGWAFVDFTSIEHATTALTNTRNHHLDGRKLVVEYASADAVRRGGGGPRPPKDGQRKDAAKGTTRPSFESRKRPRLGKDEADEAVSYEVAPEPKQTPSKPFAANRKDQGKRPRATPGAALALAKREQVAIVPSQGTKITFD